LADTISLPKFLGNSVRPSWTCFRISIDSYCLRLACGMPKQVRH